LKFKVLPNYDYLSKILRTSTRNIHHFLLLLNIKNKVSKEEISKEKDEISKNETFSSINSLSAMTQKRIKSIGLEQIQEEDLDSASKPKVKAWKNMELLNSLKETCIIKMKQDIINSNNSNSSTIVEDDLTDLNDYDIPIFSRELNYFWK